tara:strand:+ start:305 stop:589 length:285 start_codon:yes stop_codon:yes gene_type:complete
MKDEIDRRASYTTAVLDLFLSRPFAWIDVRTLAEIGGFSGWRTRVSESRQIVADRRAGSIQWNKQIKASAYRYVPVPPKSVPPHSLVQDALPWN